jgi:regulator of nucleoside diphosphate kinase
MKRKSERQHRSAGRSRRIYITEPDKERLLALVEDADAFDCRDKRQLEELRQELDRAEIVSQEAVPPDVATMNSRVHLRILDSEEEMTCSLVFPEDADIHRNKMSVLAPVGTALLGYGVGDVVEWEVPAGLIRLKIEEILYQPEASGDYHL